MKRYSIRRRRQRRLAVTMIVIGLCVFLVVCDRHIYPIVSEFSAAKAKADAGTIIHKAVGEMLEETQITYDDLILLSQDATGNIKSVQVDSVTVNRLKSEVVGRIRQQIDDRQMTVQIPVGNLTGSAYLTGRGPCIPIKLKLSTNVTAKITGEFIDAGINQTLHIIKLEITAEIFILLPTGRITVPYTTDYLLGQTVIVGDVPDAYTKVLTGEEDIGGIIQDFGAELPE